MPRKSRAIQINNEIIQEIQAHPRDLVKVVAAKLGLSKQAIIAHVNQLVKGGFLAKQGTTRPTYVKGINRRGFFHSKLRGLQEGDVWTKMLAPMFQGLPQNVVDLCHYGVTEIINNAIDHSGGVNLNIEVSVDANRVQIYVSDDGVGIFRKIADFLKLSDDRMALLELSKGKLTTDPKNHTGEGIFFTSRAFETFQIFSGELVFSHRVGSDCDFLLDADDSVEGTRVSMQILRTSELSLTELFNQFSSGPDEYSFNKTVVPVRLAKIGDENLISRSQAKRVIARIEKFRTVILDFEGIEFIGQGFADEIFRVFAEANNTVELIPTHAKPTVQEMINRAFSNRSTQSK